MRQATIGIAVCCVGLQSLGCGMRRAGYLTRAEPSWTLDTVSSLRYAILAGQEQLLARGFL